jgi:hypothetical protein
VFARIRPGGEHKVRPYGAFLAAVSTDGTSRADRTAFARESLS